MPNPCKPSNALRDFNPSSEVIRLLLLMCVRFPAALRNVEGLRFEREVDDRHEAADTAEHRSVPHCRMSHVDNAVRSWLITRMGFAISP